MGRCASVSTRAEGDKCGLVVCGARWSRQGCRPFGISENAATTGMEGIARVVAAAKYFSDFVDAMAGRYLVAHVDPALRDIDLNGVHRCCCVAVSMRYGRLLPQCCLRSSRQLVDLLMSWLCCELYQYQCTSREKSQLNKIRITQSQHVYNGRPTAHYLSLVRRSR